MSTATSDGLAARLRALADRQQAKIDQLRRPLTQNPTPKRLRELASRTHDGNNLERAQRALRAMADLHESGCVPTELAGIKTLAQALPLVSTRGESRGYYDYRDTHEYQDASPAGRLLQSLIDTAPSAGELARLRRQQELQAKIDRLRFADIPGFFPTPGPVVRQILDLAGGSLHGLRVLEPSAGIGTLADAASSAGGSVSCCEVLPALREILAEKGYPLIGSDFLELGEPLGTFNAVLMNPPFERGQDARHIMHAWRHLKPGGVLVAVCSEGPFYRQDKASAEFRAWVSAVVAVHEFESICLPDGAFRGPAAFRQADVRCRILRARKVEGPRSEGV